MKSYTVEVSNGLVATLPYVESVAEFDKLGGRTNVALEFANSELTYRTTLPQWWRALNEAVQAVTKVSPKTKPHPDKKDVVVIDETPRKYIARVIDSGKITLAEVQKIADAISAGKYLKPDGKTPYAIEVDLTERAPSERTTAPTKTDLLTVAELRKHPEFAKKLVSLSTKTGTQLTPASTDADIATAVSTLRRSLEREAKAAAQAKLAASI